MKENYLSQIMKFLKKQIFPTKKKFFCPNLLRMIFKKITQLFTEKSKKINRSISTPLSNIVCSNALNCYSEYFHYTILLVLDKDKYDNFFLQCPSMAFFFEHQKASFLEDSGLKK